MASPLPHRSSPAGSAAALPAAAPVPRASALRVGIVANGKLLRERLLLPGSNFAVGSDAGLPVADALLHSLLRFEGEVVVLVVPTGATGRLGFGGGVRTLAAVQAAGEGASTPEGWTLRLPPDIRGSVTVAGATVLFQFVAAPPQRHIDPAQFRPRLFTADDPLFLGLLGVFNAVGMAFYLAVAAAPPAEADSLRFLDRAASLARAQPVVLRPPPEQVEAFLPLPPPPSSPPSRRQGRSAPEAAPAPGEPGAAEAARRAEALRIVELVTDGVSNATPFLFQPGDERALDRALRDIPDGVASVESPQAPRTGGVGGRGDLGVGVQRVGPETGTEVGSGAEIGVRARVVADPAVAPDVEAGDPAAVSRGMKALRGGVETCVQRGLKQDPTLSGRVTVAFDIQGGRVGSVRPSAESLANPALMDCVVRVVRGARFEQGLTASVDGYTWVVSGQ